MAGNYSYTLEHLASLDHNYQPDYNVITLDRLAR